MRPGSHNHPLRTDTSHQSICNLLGEAFLNLKTTAEHIHYSRHFAQPDYILARYISYVHVAEKRKDMMLTKGIKFNIPHHYNLARSRVLKQSAIDNTLYILTVAPGHVPKRFSCPFRRFKEALTVNILAYQLQYCLVM